MLDTSILIGGKQLPAGIEASISAVSISELHFGLLVAPDEDVRAERVARMGLIEARFPNPLPLDDRVARAWAQLQAAVVRRGAQPRTRMADLAIAATAIAHGAVLITANTKDLKVVEDLVQIRTL